VLKYDPAELAQTLGMLPAIESWCAAVRSFAYAEAAAGRPVPGYKLVAKRANRTWAVDQHTVEIELARAGLAESDIFKPREILSPAQIEKRLGKKKAAEALTKLVKKESSGPTLVHESDPRQAITKQEAKDEFDPIVTREP
jgi:hypothetical protein